MKIKKLAGLMLAVSMIVTGCGAGAGVQVNEDGSVTMEKNFYCSDKEKSTLINGGYKFNGVPITEESFEDKKEVVNGTEYNVMREVKESTCEELAKKGYDVSKNHFVVGKEALSDYLSKASYFGFFEVKVKLPEKIKESNGNVDGNTVVFDKDVLTTQDKYFAYCYSYYQEDEPIEVTNTPNIVTSVPIASAVTTDMPSNTSNNDNLKTLKPNVSEAPITEEPKVTDNPSETEKPSPSPSVKPKETEKPSVTNVPTEKPKETPKVTAKVTDKPVSNVTTDSAIHTARPTKKPVNPKVKVKKASINSKEGIIKFKVTTKGSTKFQYKIVDVNGNIVVKSTVNKKRCTVVRTLKKVTGVYKIQVRGYSKQLKKWSKYSKSVKVVPRTRFDSMYSAQNINLYKVGLKWSAVNGSKKYRIYMSNRRNNGYKKIASTSGTTYTVNTKLADYKYFKVLAVSGKYKTSMKDASVLKVGYGGR